MLLPVLTKVLCQPALEYLTYQVGLCKWLLDKQLTLSWEKSDVTALKPGGVSGTNYVGTTALPLWMAMSPMSRLISAVPVEAVAELAPTPIGNLARAAVSAATEDEYAVGFTLIPNVELIRNFGDK
jgi:hypothetical protein